MEAPRTSLNVHLPWPQTADLLGLERADAALPARTACPLCHHRRLQVYEDSRAHDMVCNQATER